MTLPDREAEYFPSGDPPLGCEELIVVDVFYSPHYKGLAYRGYGYGGKRDIKPDVKTIIALDALIEIPGESQLGFYHLESGEVTDPN